MPYMTKPMDLETVRLLIKRALAFSTVNPKLPPNCDISESSITNEQWPPM
jgi:hypothetical protein